MYLTLEERGKCPKCGSKELEGTRSGLLKEVERLLYIAKKEGTLPKYLLLENVKNLVGKFIDDFNLWVEVLDNLGYNTYWKVVNAKDCGIPQNRERVFAISIRQDIDKGYFFQDAFDSGLRLKDFLEIDVDEKYYLKDNVQERLKITDKTFRKNVIGTTKPEFRKIGQRDVVYNPEGIIGCLTASDCIQPKQVLIVGKSYIDNWDREEVKKILQGTSYSRMFGSKGNIETVNGFCSTLLNAMDAGGGNKPLLMETNKLWNFEIKDNRDLESVREYCKTSILRDNAVSKVIDNKGTVVDLMEVFYRVREITPKEAFRLMGFKDVDYEKAKEMGMSDSVGYKVMGNSIVVNCIKGLMECLYYTQVDYSLEKIE